MRSVVSYLFLTNNIKLSNKYIYICVENSSWKYYYWVFWVKILYYISLGLLLTIPTYLLWDNCRTIIGSVIDLKRAQWCNSDAFATWACNTSFCLCPDCR